MVPYTSAPCFWCLRDRLFDGDSFRATPLTLWAADSISTVVAHYKMMAVEMYIVLLTNLCAHCNMYILLYTHRKEKYCIQNKTFFELFINKIAYFSKFFYRIYKILYVSEKIVLFIPYHLPL